MVYLSIQRGVLLAIVEFFNIKLYSSGAGYLITKRIKVILENFFGCFSFFFRGRIEEGHF